MRTQAMVGMESEPGEAVRSGLLDAGRTSEPSGGAFKDTEAQAPPSRMQT